MRNNFRHLSTWLMIIGIAVSFFAYLNCTDVYTKVKYAAAEINQYQYVNSYYMSVADVKENTAKEVVDALSNIEGNILFTELTAYIDKSQDYHAVELLINQTEEFPFPVEYINKDNGDIYIGEKLLSYCYSDEDTDDLFIDINSDSYLVKGILKSKNTELLNYKIILDYIPGKTSKLIESHNTYVVNVGSNVNVLDDALFQFYDEMKNNCEVYFEKNDNSNIEVGSASEEENFYMIISVFAIVNCIIISEFWIIRRKKEMIIRKLWGFSDFKIFCLLYKDMLLNSGTAVVLVIIIQGIIQILTKNEYGNLLIQDLFMGIIFTIISSFIIILLPLYKIREYRISEGMSE